MDVSCNQKKHFINARIVSALDKCKISDRNAIHIILAIAEALGDLMKYDVNELVISRAIIQRIRKENRIETAKNIKENFQVYNLKVNNRKY